MKLPLVVLVLSLALALARSAAAELDDAQKQACADAYDNSQVLRDEGRLELARAQLEVCQRACPAVLAGDCKRWQVEIEARLPAVAIAAVDAEGRAVSARLSIDGQPAVPLPAGRIPLEPGKHRLVVTRIGDGAEVELLADLPRDGDTQQLTATFGTEVEAGPSGAEVAAVVLASLGGAALLVAGALAMKGHVDRGELYDCRPRCAQADVDAVASMWTASGIVAGIGVAALGAALAVWLADDEADAGDSLGLSPTGLWVRF